MLTYKENRTLNSYNNNNLVQLQINGLEGQGIKNLPYEQLKETIVYDRQIGNLRAKEIRAKKSYFEINSQGQCFNSKQHNLTPSSEDSNLKFNNSSFGTNQATSLLTTILPEVITQNVYELSVANKYLNIEPIQSGRFTDAVMASRLYVKASDVQEISMNDPMSNATNSANMDTFLIPTMTLATGHRQTILESMAYSGLPFIGLDTEQEKERQTAIAIKNKIETNLLFGNPRINGFEGLFNHSQISIAPLGYSIENISSQEAFKEVILKDIIYKYRSENNNISSVIPNKLIISRALEFALKSRQINPFTAGGNTKAEDFFDLLVITLQKNFGNNFTVEVEDTLGAMDSNGNDVGHIREGNVNRMILGRFKQDQCISYGYTIPLTRTADMVSENGWSRVSTSYVQFTGVVLKRPQEILYIDSLV